MGKRKHRIKEIDFNSKHMFITESFLDYMGNNPKVLARIMLKPDYRRRVENYDVFYYRIGSGVSGKPPFKYYLKQADFLEGKPIGRKKAYGNKSPEREFFNYLRVQDILGSSKAPLDVRIAVPSPLFCYHDYSAEKSYLATEAADSTITLEDYLSIQELSSGKKLKAVKMAEATLRALNSNGIIHKDPNPGNFLFSRIDSGLIYLIDFEYTLFHGDERMTEMIASTGKSFDDYSREEVGLFRKQTNYEGLSLMHRLLEG